MCLSGLFQQAENRKADISQFLKAGYHARSASATRS